MEFNWKSQRFVPFFYEIKHEYDLTAAETEVYGHLYNICINLNKKKGESGWCGYSNSKLSEYSNVPERTYRRHLATLEDKGLIKIEDKQSATRKIYLTSDPFLSSKQLDFDEIEINRLKTENMELKALLSDFKQDSNDWWYNNPFLSQLKALGMLRADEMERANQELIPIYNEIINLNHYGFTNMGKHFSYISKQYQKTKVQDNVSWLKTAAEQYFNKLK